MPTRNSIADNQIADLTPLAGLTALTYVDLERNQIADIDALSDLARLRFLDLSGNHISDITPLAGTADLVQLRLSRNQIDEISPLAGLGNLAELAIDENHLSDLTAIASLELTYLYAEDQELPGQAATGANLRLPIVVGRGPLTWQVWEGQATLSGDRILSASPGTLVLGFDDARGFSGRVVFTITA